MVNGARRFLRIGVRAPPPGDRCCAEGERERLRRAAPSPLAMIVFAVEYCINRAKMPIKSKTPRTLAWWSSSVGGTLTAR